MHNAGILWNFLLDYYFFPAMDWQDAVCMSKHEGECVRPWEGRTSSDPPENTSSDPLKIQIRIVVVVIRGTAYHTISLFKQSDGTIWDDSGEVEGISSQLAAF